MERSPQGRVQEVGRRPLYPQVCVVGSRAPQLQFVISSSHRVAPGTWISEPPPFISAEPGSQDAAVGPASCFLSSPLRSSERAGVRWRWA